MFSYRHLHQLRSTQKLGRNAIPMLHIRTDVVLVEHKSRIAVKHIVVAAVAAERRHNSFGNRIQMPGQLGAERFLGAHGVGRDYLKVLLWSKELARRLDTTAQLVDLIGRIGEEHKVQIGKLVQRAVNHSVGAFEVELSEMSVPH